MQTSDVPPNHRLCCSFTLNNRSPPSWGYDSTREKVLSPVPLRSYNTQKNKTRPMAPTLATSSTSQPLIPHNLSHPRKCTPSLLHNPSTVPLPFQGFNNRIDQGSLRALWHLEHKVALKELQHPLGQHIGKPIPNNSLTQRECSTGLTTCFFNPNHQGFIG
jgi:hypothetical protein